MRVSTRARAIMLALTITIVFFILENIDLLSLLDINFKFDFIELLLIAFIMYFGVAWVANFRISGERFITVLLFPSLSVFILTLYIDLIIGSIFGDVSKLVTQIFASIVVAIISYVLVLTANVLNVGFLEKIPLTQAGRAAHYVLTLISAYLFYSIIFNNSFSVIIKLGAVFLLTYLFTNIALWTIDIRQNQRILSSFGISLMLSNLTFVLMIWPIGSEYLALILSLVYYMALGVALEIREVLNVRIWLEYGFIYFVIVLILLIISSWGINGRLI